MYCAQVPFEQYLLDWHESWVSSNQISRIHADNSQKHVKDFLRFVDYDDVLSKHISEIGNLAIGAGLGAVTVGLVAILFGLSVKGKY